MLRKLTRNLFYNCLVFVTMLTICGLVWIYRDNYLVVKHLVGGLGVCFFYWAMFFWERVRTHKQDARVREKRKALRAELKKSGDL